MALHGYAALGALVGLVVGAVEILQRYRDTPFRAVFNLWEVGYVLLNAAISYGTFWVVYHWSALHLPRRPIPCNCWDFLRPPVSVARR